MKLLIVGARARISFSISSVGRLPRRAAQRGKLREIGIVRDDREIVAASIGPDRDVVGFGQPGADRLL